MIPWPSHVAAREGTFELTPETALIGPPELTELVRQELPGLGVRWVSEGHPNVELAVDETLEREGYELQIDQHRLAIAGGSAAGVFYGLQTVKQLLPPDACRKAPLPGARWTVGCGTVKDAPKLRWRGLLLDVARHFVPKDFVLKLIDVLALHKFNTLQLHLTDDEGWRLESRRYPRLTEVGAWRQASRIHGQTETDGTPHGGFYTRDDLREIVAYAATKHVDVVPEIELPAHARAAINAYPELGTDPTLTSQEATPLDGLNVLNVEDATFRFVFDVLEEVLDIFPSEFVHVGGDECPKEPWQNDPRAQAKIRAEGLADENELQSWFMSRVDRWLADRGRRLVGWDEVVEGDLTAGAVVMSWHGEAGGIAAVRAGHDVVMAPHVPTYFDYYQSERADEPAAMGRLNTLELVYDHLPTPAELTPDEAARVLGTQCQVWSEFLTSAARVEYMAFPRACAFAEVAWHNGKPGTYDDFVERLRPQLERLDAIGVNYRPLDGPRPWQRGGTGRLRRPT